MYSARMSIVIGGPMMILAIIILTLDIFQLIETNRLVSGVNDCAVESVSTNTALTSLVDLVGNQSVLLRDLTITALVLSSTTTVMYMFKALFQPINVLFGDKSVSTLAFAVTSACVVIHILLTGIIAPRTLQDARDQINTFPDLSQSCSFSSVNNISVFAWINFACILLTILVGHMYTTARPEDSYRAMQM